jgi:hypothetical protein
MANKNLIGVNCTPGLPAGVPGSTGSGPFYPGHPWVGMQVSGTNTYGRFVIPLNMIDAISLQFIWGSITGSIKVEISNSFISNQNDPINASGKNCSNAIQTGSWDDITALASYPSSISQPAGSPGDTTIYYNELSPVGGSAWLAVSYTNSTGSGPLDFYYHGKGRG